MSRAWFFQANPAHFDIDAALERLEEIWWRVPQYTYEVRHGDTVVIWRSGKDAGIVATGTVLQDPQSRQSEPAELPFLRGDAEPSTTVTRALVTLSPTGFVSKERVRELRGFADHQIVRAPMGTVFPMSESEWAELAAFVVAPPPLRAEAAPAEVPSVFAWEERAKGVLPMPGGYDGYLSATRRVCRIVDDLHPSSVELVQQMIATFGVTDKAARLRESFLRKAGIIQVDSGLCQVSAWARRWLDTGDDTLIVALLHSRCRFIGEMLSELTTPRSSVELLNIVNQRYGLAWETLAQLDNRRGWLQSSGVIGADADGNLRTTPLGTELVQRLTLYVPSDVDNSPALTPPATLPEPTSRPLERPAQPSSVSPTDALAEELIAASTASTDPNRFERAVRDAFRLLGFDAEWLGGSGRTDVLLDAPLGKGESYRVAVDAKTTGSGSLPDQQVDWTTLVEHRQKHQADYSLLVAPNPSAGRLIERAKDHKVAVLSARQLAGLCRQHARAPLGLADYRGLFNTAGEVNTSELEEAAEEGARLLDLATKLLRSLEARAMTFGRLTARDLWLILAHEEASDVTSSDEIQTVLDGLANPLVRAIDGDPTRGYVPASAAQVAALRLGLLAGLLDPIGRTP